MNPRKAHPGDLRAIERMAQRFMDSTPYGAVVEGKLRADSIRNIAAAAMTDGLALVLPVDPVDDEPELLVGMLGALPLVFPLTGEPYGEELVWWVDEAHRGGRGAYKMLRWFEDWARQTGLRLVKMVGPADDAQLRGVLERLGYRAVETTFLKRL